MCQDMALSFTMLGFSNTSAKFSITISILEPKNLMTSFDLKANLRFSTNPT